MRIGKEQRDGATILRPQGPLIGADAEHLGEQLTAVVDESPGPVVLDASKVAFVDSRGLEILVEATERLIRNGQVLKLTGVNATVREVLELTELSGLFERFDDVDAAVGSLA